MYVIMSVLRRGGVYSFLLIHTTPTLYVILFIKHLITLHSDRSEIYQSLL